MTALIAGLVTLVFTTLLTIAGVGAAFILIPVFLALGVELHSAMATALLLNAISMGVASVRFLRARLVVMRVAAPLAVAAVVLSPVGVRVSQGLDRNLLLWLFVAFLVFAAAMMLFYQPRARETAGSPLRLYVIGTAVGGFAGFVGGLLGVGGGNLILPVLVWLGFEPKKASATTSFVVVFASLAGFFGHVSLRGLGGPLLASTAIAAALGALAGSWLMTERLKSRQVKLIIGVVLLGIAIKMTWGLVA